jgi:hypothetical protein
MLGRKPAGCIGRPDDYTFVIDQLTMPTLHGHFLLMASTAEQLDPRKYGYVMVL